MNIVPTPALVSDPLFETRANPLSMNTPAYFTIPSGSQLVSGSPPCLEMKSHLRAIIELIAQRYGPYTDLRVLAGNVIGAGGWCDLPTVRQHEYVNLKAGAFIASGMMYLEVSGNQAAEVLNFLTPRDIHSLRVGRAMFTLFTSPTGGIDEEALILRTADQSFLVSCGGGSAPSYLHEALELFPDATVRASDIVSFNIKGPERIKVMESLIDEAYRPAILKLKPFTSTRCKTLGGAEVHVVRTIIGMEMWGLPDAITPVWETILDKPESVLPCGWDLLDSYRMECKDIEFLLHPLDMNYETSLHDIGLGWMATSYDKAHYVGKDALQKKPMAPN